MAPTTQSRSPRTSQSAAASRRWLLVTDVDDTLLGDDDSLAELLERAAGAPLTVVLNSSRPIASVLSDAARFGKWRPDGVIGALGTEIELLGEPVTDWQRRFAGWDRAQVDAVMTSLRAGPHDVEYQTPYKASYDLAPARWPEAERSLLDAGLACRVIGSGSGNFDVIPAAAGKGAATIYVARRLEIPRQRLITAGDSANDADLLAAGNGIAVSNASAALLELVGRDGVYRSSRAHAAGVLDGLKHYGVPI